MNAALLIALLVAGPDPVPPPLVEAPPIAADVPRVKLTPETRAELIAKRTTLLDQRPDLGTPLTLTIVSGVVVVAAVVMLFVAFFSSWKSVPCSGFLCVGTQFTPSQATGEWIVTPILAAVGAVALPLSIRSFVRAKSADNRVTEQVDAIDDTLARGHE